MDKDKSIRDQITDFLDSLLDEGCHPIRIMSALCTIMTINLEESNVSEQDLEGFLDVIRDNFKLIRKFKTDSTTRESKGI